MFAGFASPSQVAAVSDEELVERLTGGKEAYVMRWARGSDSSSHVINSWQSERSGGEPASMIERALDLTLQYIAASIIAWPLFKWTSLPVAPTGLTVGALIGIGNGPKWTRERRTSD